MSFLSSRIIITNDGNRYTGKSSCFVDKNDCVEYRKNWFSSQAIYKVNISHDETVFDWQRLRSLFVAIVITILTSNVIYFYLITTFPNDKPLPSPAPEPSLSADTGERKPSKLPPEFSKVCTLNFSFNQAYINEFSLYKLKKELDTVLPQYNGYKYRLVISGHTDNTGSYEANMKVSKQRAEIVFTEVVKLGYPQDNIDIIARGPDEPIASNDTIKGREQNRRVEITVHLVQSV